MKEYKPRYFVFILLLFFVVCGYGQDTLKNISGKIIDFKTKEPISFVIINVLFENSATESSYNGNFKLNYRSNNPIIVIRKLGYETLTINLNSSVKSPLVIHLKTQSKDLSEIAVTANKTAKRLVDNTFYVTDYQFINDKILLFGDVNEKKQLRLITTNGDALHNYKLNNELYNATFKDCFGNIHLINDMVSTQIYITNNTIGALDDIRRSLFDSLLSSCILNTDECFYFENIFNKGQTKRIFSIEKSTKQLHDLGLYSDGSMIKMLINENEFMDSKYGNSGKSEMDDLSADELKAMRRKADDMIFFNTVILKDAYIPVYADNDTIYIFDHPNNLIHSYSLNNNMPLQLKTMEYNHFKKWKPLVIFDEVKNKFYTTYLQDGIITIGEINMLNGKINKRFTLKHTFPKNIKINNGVVYYLYRVKFTSDKMALYSYPVE